MAEGSWNLRNLCAVLTRVDILIWVLASTPQLVLSLKLRVEPTMQIQFHTSF